MADVKVKPKHKKDSSNHQGSRRRFRSDNRPYRNGVLTAFHILHADEDISDPLKLNTVEGDDPFDARTVSAHDHDQMVLPEGASRCDPLNLLADCRKETQRKRKEKKRRLSRQKREEARRQSIGEDGRQSTGDEDEKAEKSDRSMKRKRPIQDGDSTADDEPGKSAKKRKNSNRLSSTKDGDAAGGDPAPVYRPQDAKFVYGNYSRYYGYRNPHGQPDSRLKCLPESLFVEKACLDIGCNTGQMTLSIARDSKPSHIIGVDIDQGLIDIAERNVRHYVVPHKSVTALPTRKFPMSLQLAYGPLVSPFLRPPAQPVAGKAFPLNVSFKQENYVLSAVKDACSQQPEYHTVLALSITKWIHLNWGDDGIHALFHRAYHHIHPGGCFVLEPQLWASYSRKSKITSTTAANYDGIELKPDMFEDYLLNHVGFSCVESLPTAKHDAKGFQRPMYVFNKAATSDSYCNRCRPKDHKKKKVKRAVQLSDDSHPCDLDVS